MTQIIIIAVQPFVGPCPLLQFLDPWMGDQPVARPLSTNRTRQTQNKHTLTSMPRVFDRTKTDHAATMMAEGQISVDKRQQEIMLPIEDYIRNT
jgi:hypothetical protein